MTTRPVKQLRSLSPGEREIRLPRGEVWIDCHGIWVHVSEEHGGIIVERPVLRVAPGMVPSFGGPSGLLIWPDIQVAAGTVKGVAYRSRFIKIDRGDWQTDRWAQHPAIAAHVRVPPSLARGAIEIVSRDCAEFVFGGVEVASNTEVK
jgi:hypothetical protein